MFSLRGKAAFVTGGAAGIGLAIARRFARAGANVIIADVADGTNAATEIGGSYLKLDVADDSAVRKTLEAAVEMTGKLHVLVNNAGITANENWYAIKDGTTANLERIFSVNTYGVFHGLKHGPAFMHDGGSIINTSSLASTMGLPGNSQYSGTKAAVDQISRIAALELGPRRIRVNAVCPSFVRTDMGGGDLGAAMAKRVTALGRIGEADELAALYHFLAADDSAYITGQVFNFDGGWSAGISEQLMATFPEG